MRPVLLTQFDFHHTLEVTPGVSLICFTAPQCGACRAMRQALARRGLQDPSFTLFEVDSQRDLALTREFEVFHLPSLFLYRDGQFHGALQAPPVAGSLQLAIGERLAQPPDEAP